MDLTTQTRAKTMMRRGMIRFLVGMAVAAGFAGAAGTAAAQEIQITGPLAGAPAVRELRLHREGRFEAAPTVSFSLLDEYQRTIMPGLRATYHPTDWLGFGVWGGFGLHYATGLTDELQQKAIDDRRCDVNGASRACTLTAVNLTRGGGGRTGQMTDDQLGAMTWIAAPQITVVPFRGKLALFSTLFVDTDVNFFVGPAFIGVDERKACGRDDDGNAITACSQSFELESRVAIAPTFGMGFNFYPMPYLGFGFEWRGLPFSWNTSGFDNHGSGEGEEFPDYAVNDADREFHFNSMMTLGVSVQFPTEIKTSE